MGFGDDAYGKLKQIEKAKPEVAYNPQFRALAGMAELLGENYGRAAKWLRGEGHDPEVATWKALLDGVMIQEAMTSTHPEGNEHTLSKMRAIRPYLSRYPRPLRDRLLGIILYATSTVGDFSTAQYFLLDDKLRPRNPTDREIFDYAKARVAQNGGHKEEAQSAFEALATGVKSPRISVEAELNYLQAKLTDKPKSFKRIAKKLDLLRFRWRGDSVEYRVTKFLADQYWNRQEYPKAMRLYKVLLGYFPKLAKRDLMEKRIQEGFIKFFREHLQQHKNPLLIPTIYEEFRDLTPPGEVGDLVILQVADQLSDLGLSGMGADLLTRHAETKDKYKERKIKFKLLYQVAETHLKNKKSEAGLSALEYMDEDRLKPYELMKMNRLKSQLLAQRGDVEQALELVSPDASREGIKLRSDILAGAERWNDVERPVEHLIQELDDNEDRQEKREAVMDLAYAKALRGDKFGLQLMREEHKELMKNSKHEKEFDMLTATKENQLRQVDRSTLMSRLDDVDEAIKRVQSARGRS